MYKRQYSAMVGDTDSSTCEIYVSGLEGGTSYTFVLGGISPKNGKQTTVKEMCIRDRENSVNLFIYARMKDRIKRMNSLETGVDPVKMESRIREVDRKRKDYYQYYTGNEWGKAQNYHLSLESGLVGVGGCLKAVSYTHLAGCATERIVS